MVGADEALQIGIVDRIISDGNPVDVAVDALNQIQANAPLATNRVDLIDEDDGRGLLPGPLEEVPHPGGANADKHLHELGAGDAEEGHAGFPGHGLGHQGFAGTRRAFHQGRRMGDKTAVQHLIQAGNSGGHPFQHHPIPRIT